MPLYTYTEYISFVETVQALNHSHNYNYNSPVHLPKLQPAVQRFPITSLYVPAVQLVVLPGYIGLYYTL